MRRTHWLWVLAAGVAVAVAGCGRGTPAADAASASGAAGASAPAASGASGVAGGASGSGAGFGPVSVTTVRAERRDVPVMLEATGAVSALNSVDVKSQVASIISKVHIREGQTVRAGELLFTLDARADEANVLKAQAQLQRDQAALDDAQRQWARSKDLFSKSFVSQGAVDTLQAQVEAQQAALAADRAAVEAARVAVSFSRITAPISGRVGALPLLAGAFVQPGGAALVNITQLSPVAVTFNLAQRDLPAALNLLKDGGGLVVAELPEGKGSFKGKLQFVDNAVDAATGTVRVKAVFANADQALWPGAFVGVKVAVRVIKDAVVVPQAAIVQSPRGRIVYAVDKEGKAQPRPVEVVYGSGLDAVVTGITPGIKIVLDGRQNLRPGSAVIERAANPRGAASGASGAASGGASGSASGGNAAASGAKP